MARGIATTNSEDLQLLKRAGRFSQSIEDISTKRTQEFLPFIGAGSGGSSKLYGMAMERFSPSDFEPGRHHPQAHNSSVPLQWPISFDEMLPWYAMAETLYRVRGERDPLRKASRDMPELLPPAPLQPEHQWLATRLFAEGLHPYRLPLACEMLEGCRGCQGYICPKACKNDSVRICLRPALELYGASLLSGCSVVKLEASKSRITGVVCEDMLGNSGVLRADVVALAAGALATPTLLLRSTSTDWPEGVANTSGMVGRNLMRHCIDLYAIKPPDSSSVDAVNSQKTLAFNDFYDRGERKFGSVQSFGRLPPRRMLFASLLDDVQRSNFSAATPIVRCAEPLVRPTLERLEKHSLILASTLEDLPYPGNSITTSSRSSGISFIYRTQSYEKQRIDDWRNLLLGKFKSLSAHLLKQAKNNQRIAHACGTCRFGSSSKDSVINRENRAHDVDNLWILDASFFPSSGGTNPSLTIAANALRIAHALTGSSQVSS